MPDRIEILGVIPARGGSKGVRRKNIRMVAGQPLLAYTVAAARNSRRLTSFAVSTEDQEIADVARSLQCDVIDRPAELAGDDTPMLPVLEHAVALHPTAGYCVILQPTTPLRTGEDIDRSLELLFETKADSVVSVCEQRDCHPSRMYEIREGRLVPYAAEPRSRLRQELRPVYLRNGAIYAFRISLLKDQQTYIGPHTRPYIMPKERSVNIDDETDLEFADFLLRRQK